ncbi:unnamed protein product, partial [Durusdinium trenchii]
AFLSFGSDKASETDLIAIIDGAKKPIDSGSKEAQVIVGRCEISFYTRDYFLQRLEAMDMTMLTCLSTPRRFVLKELEDERVSNFRLNLDELEDMTSSYAEYTWIKSHQLLDKIKNVYKARKNTYFAFRLLDFGCQLAEHGCIIDLTAANSIFSSALQIWELLAIEAGDWDVVEAIFGHQFQKTRERFNCGMVQARSETKVNEGNEEDQDKADKEGTAHKDIDDTDDLCGLCLLCNEALRSATEFKVKPISPAILDESWVPLANCGHCFHLQCIASFVRSCSRTKKGGAWCPTCDERLRVKVVTWRAYEKWGVKGRDADDQEKTDQKDTKQSRKPSKPKSNS